MSKVVIYGKNTVVEAMRSGREIKKLFITNDVLKKEGEIRKYIHDTNVKVEKIEPSKLKKLIQNKYNITGALQGLVAEVADYVYADLDYVMEQVEKSGKIGFYIMLDGLEDVHNLGAILRSADATGVDAIIIPKNGSVNLNPTVARLSAGAIEYVNVIQVTNLNKTIEKMKKKGIWFVGTDASNSSDYRTVDMTAPTCIVIGSEGRGMSRMVKDGCDFKVYLPMVGKITSLNASVAAALLMYEVYNQRNPVQIKK